MEPWTRSLSCIIWGHGNLGPAGLRLALATTRIATRDMARYFREDLGHTAALPAPLFTLLLFHSTLYMGLCGASQMFYRGVSMATPPFGAATPFGAAAPPWYILYMLPTLGKRQTISSM